MPRKSFAIAASIATLFCASATFALGQSAETKRHHRIHLKPAPPMMHDSMTKEERRSIVTANSSSSLLPVWSYQSFSSRDGNLYEGLIVGRNPNERGSDASATVTAQVIPIILKFHTLGTSVNLNTGIITTKGGNASADPTVADTGCFAGSNNVPVQLMAQSPILNNADFNFGGTDVGTTQYVDAVQRASFWNLIDKNNYHVRFNGKVLAPIVVDVPAKSGLSLGKDAFGPQFAPMCSNEGLVDINFLDNVAVNALFTEPGVNPGTFPMFMIYNSGMSIGDPTNLGNCCAGGYHSIYPVDPITFQAYSPFDFDVSGFFVPSANDTAIVSHEAGEFINDPYITNNTPAWGHTGQVGGCQGDLEVGDPLTGTEAPRIVGKNGFTYHLQELAFFSWFYGPPSIGAGAKFSDNGTFTVAQGACQ